jgi:CRP-like cAMP-binding protein
VPHSNILIRKLQSIALIDDDDSEAVRRLPIKYMDLRADQDVVREGDRPTRSCVLVQGMACWFKTTGDGKRQIMAFQIPGDIPDLQSLHLEYLDATLATITPCSVAFVQHEALHAICERHPRIASAFWRNTLIDAAIFREWVVNVGSRQAYSRIAHLFCEMLVRMNAVGLAEGNACRLPITQTELGDATGLSTVHVNRTLQELRVKGLISFDGVSLQVLNWPALQEAGDFHSAYLHLKSSGTQRAAAS